MGLKVGWWKGGLDAPIVARALHMLGEHPIEARNDGPMRPRVSEIVHFQRIVAQLIASARI